MPDRLAPGEITLLTPLADVRGVRRDHADALALLGVRTVADIIRHLPMRYERQEAETTIDQLAPGQIISVRGDITATRISGFGSKARFQAVLVDPTGRLDLVWFNGGYLKNQIYPGLRVRVQGKAAKFGPGLQVVNPRWEILREEKDEPDARDARIRPVYPASEHVSSRQIETIVGRVLDPAAALIPEHLPEDFRAARHMPLLADAYRMAHAPENMPQADEARRRLAYDELLLLQLGVFLRRAQQRATVRGPVLAWSPAIDARIRARFAFPLTAAQDRVVGEIAADLRKDDPANRLIQGDVGSGKTVVALYAMLMAVASRQQAALMAPTELLAEQHHLSISRMLEGSDVKIALLTSAVTGAERDALLSRLASGDIDILIGTHALLTESVRFESLAVAVIDEQHRFGVHQRARLRSKGGFTTENTESTERQDRKDLLIEPPRRGSSARSRSSLSAASTSSSSTPPPLNSVPSVPSVVNSGSPDPRPLAPHVLVMTATPIPRTLALTLFGDLDVSTIDQLPPGRSPITTRIVAPNLSGEVYQFVRSHLDKGEQAYIVVPMIDGGASSAASGEGGGDAELNDLRTVHARLEAHELAGKRIAALHGRLKRDTREAIMARFRAGQIDALVATTVIEVGVDVPAATVMVVEHAERFGLAQLHQLRGRVGRGGKKSFCILIGEPATPDAESRLAVMARTTDGFELAEKDLEIRGPGEVFGLRQAGAPPLLVADLTRDRELLALARRDAQAWITRSPRLDNASESLLRKRLMKAHGQWLGLGDVG